MPFHFQLKLARVECLNEQRREIGKDEMRLLGFGVTRKGHFFSTGFRDLGSFGTGDVSRPGMPLLERELEDDGQEVLVCGWLVEEDGGGVRDAAASLRAQAGKSKAEAWHEPIRHPTGRASEHSMNPTGSSRSDEELLAKIRSLPPDKAAEVEDFVDFLSQAWATAGCRALRRGCPKRPSDGSGTTPRTTSKRRSAAIVSSDPYHERRPDVLILAITSQSSEPDALAPGPIRDWRDAGLLRKSVLKPIVATLQRELVLRRLGRLAEDDRALLREMLSAMLGLRGA